MRAAPCVTVVLVSQASTRTTFVTARGHLQTWFVVTNDCHRAPQSGAQSTSADSRGRRPSTSRV